MKKRNLRFFIQWAIGPLVCKAALAAYEVQSEAAFAVFCGEFRRRLQQKRLLLLKHLQIIDPGD